MTVTKTMEFPLYGPNSLAIRNIPPTTNVVRMTEGRTLLAFRLLSNLPPLLEGHTALRLIILLYLTSFNRIFQLLTYLLHEAESFLRS
jgi:hypothetical protein